MTKMYYPTEETRLQIEYFTLEQTARLIQAEASDGAIVATAKAAQDLCDHWKHDIDWFVYFSDTIDFIDTWYAEEF